MTVYIQKLDPRAQAPERATAGSAGALKFSDGGALRGTVGEELTPEASGKSTLAVIQPGADPRTVRHVFIITNY